MSENEYLVALYAFLPFGPVRTRLLLDYFGSAESAWKVDEKELREINLSEKLINNFIIFKKNFDDTYFATLEKLNIQYVTFKDKNYPKNLLEIEDFPLVLYTKGRIKAEDSNAVAIIGSRKMTSYGKEVSSRFASELASRGVTIVSGLALGIDAVAHKAALDAGGRTIAVIASGLDNITPVSNRKLAEEFIREDQGVVVTEFPLGHQPQRHDFAVRNRIISGLSKAVVVVEGEIKSGTLLTASHAAQQGRQVFTVPGQITSPMSGASNYLLKNGAHMAVSIGDVLEELDMQLQVNKEEVEKIMPADEVEELLVNIITNEPLHLDEIVRQSEIDTPEVTAKLTMMEIKGLVKNLGSGVYGRS